MECKSNNPYPEVKVKCKNIEYAKILLEDYAGVISEDSAIHQYIYQHFDKFNVDEEFSETLKQIAMVEMKHLELLGKTIKLLGLDPKFKFIDKYCNSFTYWSSSFVDYTINIVDMLIDDIEIERKAIENYKYHISIIDDPYIKRTLNRIIEDEEIHIKCFNVLLEKVIH